MSIVNTETGEIVAVHPEEPGAVAMLTQAITWLTTALGEMPIEEIVTTRAKVATIQTATKELGMSKEAQELAAEAVRRAEWSLGRAIRKGQEEGTVATREQAIRDAAQEREAAKRGEQIKGDTSDLPRMTDLAGREELTGNGAGILHLAEADLDEFDDAIREAKAEGNLSRANVVRKLKGAGSGESRDDRAHRIAELAREGHTSGQIAPKVGVAASRVRIIARDYGIDIPADRAVGKRRALNSDRILSGAAESLEVAAFSLQQVNPLELDQETAQEWIDSLTESLTALRKAVNSIKESFHG